MRVALVYDDLIQSGGAERFFKDVYNSLDKPDVYVALVPSSKLSTYLNLKYNKTLSFIATRFGTLGYTLASLLSVYWFERLNLSMYDRVVVLCNRFSVNCVTNDQTSSSLIVTTPNRYFWGSGESGILSILKNYKRIENYFSAKRHNIVISISKVVQKRVKKFWSLDSYVLHPPVKNFVKIKPNKIDLPFEDYFLMVGRINKYKFPYFYKVLSLLPKDKNIVMVGEGTKFKLLKKVFSSHKNIYFTGFIDDSKLAYLYKNSKLLIHPQVEDFGLTPLEALQFNKPTIAYNKGGLPTFLTEKVCGFYKNDDELVEYLKENKRIHFSEIEASKILHVHSFDNFKYNLEQIFKTYEKSK